MFCVRHISGAKGSPFRAATVVPKSYEMGESRCETLKRKLNGSRVQMLESNCSWTESSTFIGCKSRSLPNSCMFTKVPRAPE